MSDTGLHTTLHGYYRSSAAFRVRIALNLKGVEYRSVAHHLRKGEQRSPSYLALNPQGLVPVLEMSGHAFTQSIAIIELLEEIHPFPALLPAGPFERARVRAMVQLICSDIHPLDNLRVLAYLRTEFGQSQEAVQRWYGHWITEGFAALEQMLSDSERTGQFCDGNAPSLADVCLVPQVKNARNFDVDLAGYPTIVKIADRAAQLPAFLAAMPENQPDAEDL